MRLIDADVLRDEIENYFGDLMIQGRHDILEIVKKSPTVDAFEVVRCKDCVHCDCSPDYMGFFYCDFDEGRTVSPNGFCEVAKRRKETEDDLG